MCQNNAVNRDITNAIALALAVGSISSADPLLSPGWAWLSHDDKIDLIDAAAKALDQATTAAGFWERWDFALTIERLAEMLLLDFRGNWSAARTEAAFTRPRKAHDTEAQP